MLRVCERVARGRPGGVSIALGACDAPGVSQRGKARERVTAVDAVMHRKSAKERDHSSLACGVLELSHRYLLIVLDGDPQRSSTSMVPVRVRAFAARLR